MTKDFYTKVCAPTNERYKTYQTGFSSCRLGHALRVGLGVLRCQKLNTVCRSVMLTSSKPSDEIQPNLVGGDATEQIVLGQKVKYHYTSITKSFQRL